MISKELWCRESARKAARFNLFDFLWAQLLDLARSSNSSERTAAVIPALALLGTLFGLSIYLVRRSTMQEGRYTDSKLGQLYEITVCLSWAVHPPFLERCWRGYCHYQDLDSLPKETYAWHVKGNLKQAYDILTGKVNWGPNLDDLKIVEVSDFVSSKTDGSSPNS